MQSTTTETKYTTIKLNTEKYLTLRRNFHRIPEIGHQEFKTKKLIIQTLNEFKGFSENAIVTEVGETGLFIDIFGTSSLKLEKRFLISLRADIDALPFQEESNLEYKSEHEKMNHACGHDGHTTILLATIEYYLERLSTIPSNFGVRFLFQPAEEGLNGAKSMIKGGCLDSIDEIYGLHNETLHFLGEISAIEGTMMARVDTFDIKIKGHGGHSSRPHDCVSPINVGTQIITALNHISSQEIDSLSRHSIGVGCFKAGETYNVIPESGIIKGTIRTIDDKTGDKLIERIEEVSISIGKLNKAEIEFEKHIINCTSNHKEQALVVQEIANKYFKLNNSELPVMGSEDFCYYLLEKPGCYFFIGCRDEEHTAIMHTPKFDFNDKGFPIGVEMFIRIIEKKSGTKLI
jgi:amidohydrolase